MTATDAPVQKLADVDGIVTDAVTAALAAGDEVALQVCVQAGSRRLADVTAGWRDLGTREPADADSLFTVFSVTKGVVAAAAAGLASDGVLDPDAPAASCWPEFAARGKHGVTLAHLLTHTAGIPQMPAGVTVGDMCDWERMTARIADLEPMWPAGTTMAYHGYTFGWAVGEVLRRAVGQDVGDLVRAQAVTPAGTGDFWLGVPPDAESRIVTLYKDEGQPRRGTGLPAAAIPPALDTGPRVYNRSDVRRACLPAAGGIASARALAAIYATLAARAAAAPPGSALARAVSVQRDETDLVTGYPTARGLGFIVAAPSERLAPFGPGRPGFGHPGAGGSVAWADLRTGTGIAITRSRLTGDGWRGPVVQRLVGAALAAADAADRQFSRHDG